MVSVSSWAGNGQGVCAAWHSCAMQEQALRGVGLGAIRPVRYCQVKGSKAIISPRHKKIYDSSPHGSRILPIEKSPPA